MSAPDGTPMCRLSRQRAEWCVGRQPLTQPYPKPNPNPALTPNPNPNPTPNRARYVGRGLASFAPGGEHAITLHFTPKGLGNAQEPWP